MKDSIVNKDFWLELSLSSNSVQQFFLFWPCSWAAKSSIQAILERLFLNEIFYRQWRLLPTVQSFFKFSSPCFNFGFAAELAKGLSKQYLKDKTWMRCFIIVEDFCLKFSLSSNLVKKFSILALSLNCILQNVQKIIAK